MRLSLKTKFTLATSLLVLAVVASVSALYLGRLMRQTLAASERQRQLRGAAGLQRLRERARRSDRARRRTRLARSRRCARLRSPGFRQQQHAQLAD